MWCPLLAVAICCAVPGVHVPAIAERPEPLQLDVILKDWEIQSQRGKVIQIEFKRYRYDHVFQTEIQSTGRLIYGDGQFRFDIEPVKYKEGQKSRKEGYRLIEERSETWIGNATLTKIITHPAQRIDVFRRTAESASNNQYCFFKVHVPSYLRIQADDLKRRFRVSLLDDTDKRVVFEMEPCGKPESLNWSSITVMWSPKQRRVQAVKFINPARAQETVYVVNDYLIDPPLELKSVMNPPYPNYYIREYRGE